MEMVSSICYKNNSKQLVFSNTHNDAEFLASNVEGGNDGIRIQIHRGGLMLQMNQLFEIVSYSFSFFLKHGTH